MASFLYVPSSVNSQGAKVPGFALTDCIQSIAEYGLFCSTIGGKGDTPLDLIKHSPSPSLFLVNSVTISCNHPFHFLRSAGELTMSALSFHLSLTPPFLVSHPPPLIVSDLPFAEFRLVHQHVHHRLKVKVQVKNVWTPQVLWLWNHTASFFFIGKSRYSAKHLAPPRTSPMKSPSDKISLIPCPKESRPRNPVQELTSLPSLSSRLYQ